jgi:two-component system, NarL family, response regulator DevR
VSALGNGSNSVHKGPIIRIFLVEDSAIIRERLLRLLDGLDGVEVIGHADNATDAVAGIVASAPDVVVLDIKLKNGSGIEVLRHIKHRLPRITVIMLTNYATGEYRRRCFEAGAQYFLDKTNEFQKLQSILDQLRRNDQIGANPSC